MPDTPTASQEAPAAPGIGERLRAAFNGESVPHKNIALRQAAALIESQSAEIAQASDEVKQLIESIWRAEYRHSAPNWKPLPDLVGMVTQLDNMYAGVREQRDRARWDLAAANARIAALEAADRENSELLEAAIEGQSYWQARAEKMERILREARLQLEYLDGRFPTGTTPAVIACITGFLADAQTTQGGGLDASMVL